MDTADELDATCRRPLYLCSGDCKVSFYTILGASICRQAGEIPGIELGVARDLEALFDNYVRGALKLNTEYSDQQYPPLSQYTQALVIPLYP